MPDTPLCSIAQIDAMLERGGTAASYTEESKIEARDAATAAFEAEAGVAFTPRTTTRTVRARGGLAVFIPDAKVQSVTGVVADGRTLTESDLTYVYNDGGSVYGLGGSSFAITYVHGFETCPPDVSRAVAVLAASLLKDGPYDDRGFGVTDEGGSVRLLTAGISGAAFSIPEVQAALVRYKRAPSI